MSTRRFGAYQWAVDKLREQGPANRITSADIAKVVGTNSTQIRRDLSQLGRNGKRGCGYRRSTLLAILAPPKRMTVAVIGDSLGEKGWSPSATVATKLCEYENVRAVYGHWSNADLVVLMCNKTQAETAVEWGMSHGCTRFLNFGDFLLEVEGAEIENVTPVRTILEAVAEL